MGNPFEQIPGDRGENEKIRCPNCGGSGSVADTNKGGTKICPKCNGTGVK
jgi:hypothetical protein